jgi:hypothetical protein
MIEVVWCLIILFISRIKLILLKWNLYVMFWAVVDDVLFRLWLAHYLTSYSNEKKNLV